eukprot:COSAG01_NODE_9918_length_2302_cov_2.035406_2_plen_80_part_00
MMMALARRCFAAATTRNGAPGERRVWSEEVAGAAGGDDGTQLELPTHTRIMKYGRIYFKIRTADGMSRSLAEAQSLLQL